MINDKNTPKKDLFSKYFGNKSTSSPENRPAVGDILKEVTSKGSQNPDDTFGQNFREGLEQGTKSLLGGFAYASGEVADRLGFDKAGETTKEVAKDYIKSAPLADDSAGQFFGSLIPSVVPSAVAIGLAPYTGGASLAYGSMAGLATSSAGNGMMEYESYKQGIGEEVNANAKFAVGVAYGVAEALAERFSLNKLMPELGGKFMMKGNVRMAEEAGEDLLRRYARYNPAGYQELMRKVGTGMYAEGGEEVITEVAQSITQMLYQEQDDRIETFKEIPQNMMKAFAGGSIMGAGLGPLSFGSQNVANVRRRKANGSVILVQAEGNVYEVIGASGEGQFQALDKNGEMVELAEEQITQRVDLTPDQFDKLLQDKLDSQEVEIRNRAPQTMANYGSQQVIVNGQGEVKGKVYITLPNGEHKSVFESELENIEEISPETQLLAEGVELQPSTGEIVEAIRDAQGLQQDETGDFVYPDEQTEASEQAPVIDENAKEVFVGTGNNRKSVQLTENEAGIQSVTGVTRLIKGEPQRVSLDDLTETEISALTNELNKAFEERGIRAVREAQDGEDALSKSTIRLYEETEEQKAQRALDGYEVQANGAKVKVVNLGTGQAIGSQSKYYFPKVAQYFEDNAKAYSDMERVSDNEQVGESFLHREVARASENPVEIAEFYLMELAKNEEERSVSNKEIAIAQDLSAGKIPTNDLQGRNLESGTLGITLANYASAQGKTDIAQRAEYLSDQIGQEVTVDDILDFIKENPGGPSKVLNKKSQSVESLESRFEEVTGVQISKGLAERIADGAIKHLKEQRAESETDSVSNDEFDWTDDPNDPVLAGLNQETTPSSTLRADDDLSNVDSKEEARTEENPVSSDSSRKTYETDDAIYGIYEVGEEITLENGETWIVTTSNDVDHLPNDHLKGNNVYGLRAYEKGENENSDAFILVRNIVGGFTDKTEQKPKSQREQVEDLLSDGKERHIKEVAEALDILEPNVRRILGQGAKKGKFERVDKGVYTLTTEDGKTHAYIEAGEAQEVLPRMVEEGRKFDMIFLDPAYFSKAFIGGNRKPITYDFIGFDQFRTVVEAVSQLVASEDSHVYLMLSGAPTAKNDMELYAQSFPMFGFQVVGEGSYTKTYKDGKPVISPNGKEAYPERVLLWTKSGNAREGEIPTELNFRGIRPRGYATEKAPEFIKALIQQSTFEGDFVLDPFAGSGVTGDEAIRANRDVTLVEKDEKVVTDTIIPRISGDKADNSTKKKKSRKDVALELIGANQGDKVTFSDDIQYIKSNTEYEIESVSSKGEVSFRNKSGSGSSLSLPILSGYLKKGSTIDKVDTKKEVLDDSGESNKVFTKDATEDALAKLRAKLGSDNDIVEEPKRGYLADEAKETFTVEGTGEQIGFVSEARKERQLGIFDSEGDSDRGRDQVSGETVFGERLEPRYWKNVTTFTPTNLFELTTGKASIENPYDVAHLMRALEDEAVEHFFALYEDADGVITPHHVSTGGSSATIVEPSTIVAGAENFKAKKLYLVHNHPSGNMKASSADIALTRRIKETLPDVEIVHIIMDTYKGEFIKFWDDYSGGYMGSDIPIKNRSDVKLAEEYHNDDVKFEVFHFGKRAYNQDVIANDIYEGKQVISPETASEFFHSLRYSVGDKMEVLLLDNAKKPVAIYVVPDFETWTGVFNFTKRVAVLHGANSVIYGGRQEGEYVDFRKLSEKMKSMGISVNDVIFVDTSNKNYDNFISLRADGVIREPETEYSQVNEPAPIDPELLQLGIQVGGYFIESGTSDFQGWSQKMIEASGANIEPYLNSIYNALRYYPGIDNSGFTAQADIDNPQEMISDEINNQPLDTQESTIEAESEESGVSNEINKGNSGESQDNFALSDETTEDVSENVNQTESVQSNLFDEVPEAPQSSSPNYRSLIDKGIHRSSKKNFTDISKLFDLKNLPNAYYRKFEGGEGVDNLSIEKQWMWADLSKEEIVDPDAFILIMEQWYLQEGDIMSDPRIDFAIFPNLELAIPVTYTNSGLGIYQEAIQKGAFNKEMILDISAFVETWVANIDAFELVTDDGPIQETEEDLITLPENEQKFVGAIMDAIRSDNALNKTQLESLAKSYEVEGNTKRIKELAEYATLVVSAQTVEQFDGDIPQTYKELVDVYNYQPSMTARTAQSIKNQQYSTPIPIAYAMGVYTNLHDGVAGLEPSAGNGFLTVATGTQPDNVIVNEIDADRLQMLRQQRFFDVTDQDGTLAFEGLENTQQAIVTNPPFGRTKANYISEVNGESVTLTKLDHIMTARALDAMRDDGKGAILVGGLDQWKNGQRKIGQDSIFFNWLYNHYNVEDVINVSGKLYRKQGASFPIRVILVNGRKETPQGLAPLQEAVNGDIVDSFEGFYERINKYLTPANHEALLQSELVSRSGSSDSVSGESSNEIDQEGGGLGTVLGGGTSNGDQGGTRSEGADSTDGSRTGDSSTRDGQSGISTTATEQQSDTNTLSGLQGDSQQEQDQLSTEDADRNQSNLPSEKSTIDARISLEQIVNNEGGNILYSPLSDGTPITTEMPATMAMSMVGSLNRLADSVGNVDSFVIKNVGFKDVDDLYNSLAGEQIDAVALAIQQVQRGKSLIVGDQTGIGKGRVAATMIRYAKKQGLIPVFITEKNNLLTDMHRDLVDIGVNFKPFIVNGDTKILDKQGKTVHKTLPAKKHKDLLKSEEPIGALKSYDYVAMTYSQISSSRYEDKRNFVKRIAHRALIIMDEAHNASGASNTGAFVIEQLDKAQGAVYLSATFAKRPNNMPVYAVKTDISDVSMNMDELIEAIERGGVALQEILSSDLVDSGQMVRRQRSFKGVKRDFEVIGTDDNGSLNPEGVAQHALYDEVSDVLRDIIDFQKLHVWPVLEAREKELKDEGKQFNGNQGVKMAGVDNQPFVSRIHNVVDQMLFSVKADAVADRAIEEIKNNRKPIIAVRGTMESIVNDLFDVGEEVDLHFGVVLERALRSVMKYVERSGITGGKSYKILDVNELFADGQEAFDEIVTKANSITKELIASPLDYIVNKIEKGGYNIGEVTGRNKKIDLTGENKGVVKIRAKKERDKNTLFNGFNEGEIDALIINSSGATGASAHSSEHFGDQRQRVMIIHQPELNINTEVQKWGRIFRTGQVNLPEYQYITSSIPAETRLMMILKKKIKSLDANTTSSQKTSSGFLEMEDFINKYGDKIVYEYLQENEDLNEAMQRPMRRDDDSPAENLAMKTTGRMAFMPSEIQEEFYQEISERYASLIEMLNEYGENDLVIDSFDLQTEQIEKKLLVQGRDSGSAFGGNTYMEKVKAKVLRKPMKIEEINSLVEKELDGRSEEQYTSEWIKKAESSIDEKAEDRIARARLAKSFDQAKLNKINEDVDRIRDYVVNKLFRPFEVGQVYMIPIDSQGASKEVKQAIFLGHHVNMKAKNPFAPSNVKLKFATNDSMRTITIPGSSIQFVRATLSESMIGPYAKRNIREGWNHNQSSANFETRYIATGNILQAVNKLGSKGRLISYTTNDGKLNNGVILPSGIRDEELNKITKVRVKASKLTDKVKEMEGYWDKVSLSGGVGFSKDYDGNYLLEVPSSKARGGKYFLDEKLATYIQGDFEKRGKTMRGVVERYDIGAVLDYLERAHNIFGEVDPDDPIAETRKPNLRLKILDDVAPVISKQTEDIAQMAEELVQDWRVKKHIHIARSEEELPWVIQQYIKEDPKKIGGLYLDGEVFILAQNIKSREELEKTLLHEVVGHMGFRGLLQSNSANRDAYEKDYNELTLGIYESFKNDAEYKRIAKKYDLDMRKHDDRMIASEEFIAHMAENDLHKTFLDRAIQWVQDFLADHLGIQTKLSRADLIDLLSDMRRFVDSEVSLYADGTIMRQAFRIADEKNFAEWFSDSKVVDTEGNPLVVYHGSTNKDLTSFKKGKRGNLGSGIYFTNNESYAQDYADRMGAGNGRVYGSCLRIKNPFRVYGSDGAEAVLTKLYSKRIYKNRARKQSNPNYLITSKDIQKIKSQGYDGIIWSVNEQSNSYTEYSVFEPNQIKSSTENNGQYNPNDPDIRFKILSKEPLEEVFHQYQNKKIDWLIRRYQNKFIDGQRIQEGVVKDGGRIDDKSNFIQDELNHHGRIESQKKNIEQNYLNPLLRQMRTLNKEKGVSYEDLRQYLYANHATERNEYLFKKNPRGGDAQSGMSDTEARQVMRELDQRGILEDIQDVAGYVYGITENTLRAQMVGGLISKKEFGARRKRFENYVPLRGFKELMDIDPTMYAGNQKMEGRESKAGDILAYVMAMNDTAIIHGEKNRVKQTLLEFVKENYNRADLFRIRNVYWKRTGEIDEETGKEKWLASYDQPTADQLLSGDVKRSLDPENEQMLWEEATNVYEEKNIRLMVDGRPVVIEVTKPHLARAFKEMDVEGIPQDLATMSLAVRWLRNVVTQYSPEFGLRNLIRDSWTGLINISIDNSVADASKVINPVAYAGAFKALRSYYRKGKFDDSEWGKAMKAYMKHGAITGYWQLNEVKERTQNLKKAVEDHSFKNNMANGLKKLGSFVDDYNRILENIARVSVFKHLYYNKVINPDTNKPYTAKQSANYARNLTVNFNQKGNRSGFMGSLFLFFNATVQGVARQARPFFSKHRGIQTRAMATPVILGATSFLWNELLRTALGLDDDEEWRYDKISDWTRHHNIIIPNLFSDDPDDFIKIPLPYGYNTYWAVGDITNRIANDSLELSEGALEMAVVTVDAYNPIGTASGDSFGEATYKTFLPTLLKPGFELVTNTDFAGNQIKPEPFPNAVQPPQSQQFYPYASSLSKKIAESLNEVTGGDEFTEGIIDVSPEYIDYVFNFVGGGPAKFIGGLASTAENISDHVRGIEDAELYDIYDVPFARSMYGKVSKTVIRENFIENQKEIEGLFADYRSYYESGQVAKGEQFALENEELLGLYNDLRAVKSQLRQLNGYRGQLMDQQDSTDNREVRDKLRKVADSQYELYIAFNRLVNEVEGRGDRSSVLQKVIGNSNE
jgi:16S rRNA G966 N2-methylase RsmD